jgi:hypothetical protein
MPGPLVKSAASEADEAQNNALAGYTLLVGKFMLPRSFGENPIFPSKPINCDTSPDLSSSTRGYLVRIHCDAQKRP